MNIEIPDGRLYTMPEAGRELGVSRQSINSAIKNGRLQAIELPGRKLIHEDELARYRDERRPGRPLGPNCPKCGHPRS